MLKISGPVWKTSRRLDFSILETGEELQGRTYAPDQHGPTKRVKLTNYGQQLREEQKIRYMYGLNERQFYDIFIKVGKMKGITSDNSLGLLKSCLDNLVYRTGFVRIRRAARQLVNHGYILVNGKKADIPSSIIKLGMVVEIKEKFKDMKAINEVLEATLNTVAFIGVDKDVKEGTYLHLPERSELNSEFSELLVIESYNRQR